MQLLRAVPCITEIPENYRTLWELCLFDIWCPTSVREWRDRIDSPDASDTDQTLFINLSISDREEMTQVFDFPTVVLPSFPTIAQVNAALPNCFERNNLLKQSCVATEITDRIGLELPQIVVFLVFDGLSFYDVVDWKLPGAVLEPCLVDGLSVTDRAMQRLIGTPVLTHQLFSHGYTLRLGFSYWKRTTNTLTNTLFAEFPQTQLHRVTTFGEVLETIKAAKWTTRTYVQVIRTGLDGVCHSHRERPNITSLLAGLKKDVLLLIEVLQETEESFRLFVTSDHGILWYDDQNILPLAQERSKTRYAEGVGAAGDNMLTLNTDAGTYTVLTGDKVIAKDRKSTEWGFHGGISAQESLVPFWDVRQ